MSSPFLSVANARLTFKISGDSLGVDAWDNIVPVTETITLVALLQEAKKSGVNLPERYRKGGLDVNTKILEGFLVDPLELPLTVRPPCTGYAEIRLATNRLELGKFEMFPVSQNPFVVSAGVKDVTKVLIIFMMEDVREV